MELDRLIREKRSQLKVKDYLMAALPGLDRRKLSEVPQITRARWSAARN
jgi:hypothetical protein